MNDQVIICEYDPKWKDLYESERIKLMEHLKNHEIIDIQHFGSTSIKGLAAKPIIDIIIGFEKFDFAEKYIEILKDLDYEYLEDVSVLGGRLFLQKNPRIYHIHLVEHGTEHWLNPLIFRDFLRINPTERKLYENLKKELAITYKNDRFAYTKGKTPFINEVLKKAAY